MSLLDRLRHVGRSQSREVTNDFVPTSEELDIINQFMPENKGGFRAFVEQLAEVGIAEERYSNLIDYYRAKKHEAMRKSQGKERQA